MEGLIALLIQQAPSIIQDLKDRHAAANPDAPVLTSEQVLAAFEQVFTSSELKDEILKAALLAELAAHPNPPAA